MHASPPPRTSPRCSWDGRASSPACMRGWARRSAGSGSSCSRPESRGSARRPSWRHSSPTWPRRASPASAPDSAWSSTAPAKPTCRSSMRWDGWDAPPWLEQLPGLLSDREMAAVQRRAQGATRGRMLRELAEVLDALTREAPLVLLLEDLHWSDSSTIELLGMLARRREASRLLVLGTYRPAEVAATPG